MNPMIQSHHDSATPPLLSSRRPSLARSVVRLEPGYDAFQDSVELATQVLVEERVQHRVGARRRQPDQVDDAVDADQGLSVGAEDRRADVCEDVEDGEGEPDDAVRQRD